VRKAARLREWLYLYVRDLKAEDLQRLFTREQRSWPDSISRCAATEAEDPAGQSFDERGLQDVLRSERWNNMAAIGAAVVRAVEGHPADVRFADDLTLLLLRRSTVPAAAGV